LKNQQTLLIAMLISMVFWGLSWPSAKVVSSYSDPIVLTAYRYSIVFLTLIPILLFLKIPLRISKKGIPFVLISGFLLAIYSYLMFLGLKKGTAGAGGVLVTTLNPLMAYFLSMLIARKKPNINETIGLVLGLIAGCVLLKIWVSFDLLFNSGNLYFLASALLWSIMSRFTAKSSDYGSPFSFSLWMYFITLISLFPFIDYESLKATFEIREFQFWGNVFFGGAIVTSLATTIYFYATSKLGSAKASSFIFLVPFSAAVSSFILLDEKLEIHTMIGGVLGIAAVYMIQRKGKN
jgi:drug/metabolite transporter (DMT)-like permease